MFSVIVTFYQGTQSDEDLQRLLDSLKAQTFKDFEVIVFHDGNRIRPWNVNTDGLSTRLLASPIRYNDWGHSLRDQGIKESRGEFLLHTNADNYYYQGALNSFDKAIKAKGVEVVFSRIKMMGMEILPRTTDMNTVSYPTPRDYSKSAILRGLPKVDIIDAMQGCISKQVWESIGGWHDKSFNGDSKMYEEIASKNSWYEAEFVVGEHY